MAVPGETERVAVSFCEARKRSIAKASLRQDAGGFSVRSVVVKEDDVSNCEAREGD